MGFNLFVIWGPHKEVVVCNGFQAVLKEKLRRLTVENKKGFGLMSSLLLLDNKDNKNVRILRLQSGIENGFYRFVKGSDMQRLINQFLAFNSSTTSNEDDGPDAMELGNRALRRLNGEIEQVTVEYY